MKIDFDSIAVAAIIPATVERVGSLLVRVMHLQVAQERQRLQYLPSWVATEQPHEPTAVSGKAGGAGSGTAVGVKMRRVTGPALLVTSAVGGTNKAIARQTATRRKNRDLHNPVTH